MQKVINSGYSHISEPAQELHSRAWPSVRGNITAQLVQPQGENPGGRQKKSNIYLYSVDSKLVLTSIGIVWWLKALAPDEVVVVVELEVEE